MSTVNSNDQLGKDNIKGGVFFGNLTPAGLFSNIPNTTPIELPTQEEQSTLLLTLTSVQEQLQEEAKKTQSTTDDVYSPKALLTFLQSYTKLLIDYSDLRNFVFYGSAYSLTVFHINNLIAKYPYNAYFAKNQGTGAVNPLNQVTITYPSPLSSKIKFNLSDVLDKGNLTFDLSGNTIWTNYDLVDKNKTRFPITSLETGLNNIQISSTINFLGGVTINTSTPHNLVTGNVVLLNGFQPDFITGQINPLNSKFSVTVLSPTSFNVVPLFTSSLTITVGEGYIDNTNIYISATTNTTPIIVTTSSLHYLTNGDVITLNSSSNTYLNNSWVVNAVTPTTFELVGSIASTATTNSGIITYSPCEFTVEGIVSINNKVEFNPNPGSTFKGFLIEPKFVLTNDFYTSTTDFEKYLLKKNSRLPWPRSPITQNILIEGVEFTAWVENPSNLIDNYNADILGYESTSDGLNITSALILDNSDTNQLLRRAIPGKIADELRDTEDRYFTRFVWIAGYFFDTMKVYIDFLKFVHTINYGEFNQLSPDFYQLYAKHFGFELFDDNNVDFAKIVVRTEPGLAYNPVTLDPEYSNVNNSKTQLELQQEKQKRLLINLFYLYKTKGTLSCVEKLVLLLGSPDGLIILNEFYFDDKGNKLIDNKKVNVPKIEYEIDPEYLVNPSDVNDPVNKPYQYRLKLDNDNLTNLRELDIVIDPQGAIEKQMIEWGQDKFVYGHFDTNGFANLQNYKGSSPNPYLTLPLTQPDKYSGFTLEYMIPKGGFEKGIGQGYDETSIHLASLIKLQDISSTTLIPLSGNYKYKLPIPFEESLTVNDGFLLNDYTGTLPPFLQVASTISKQEYIFAKTEGKDLVIRANLRDENSFSLIFNSRVAIFVNLFKDDGLNHELRVLYRPEGCEVYLDRVYKGLCRWRNCSVGFNPITQPHSTINTLPFSSISSGFADPINYGNDQPAYWDLLIGLPVNVKMYYKRVAVHESLSINQDDTIDFGLSLIGQEAEKYSFSFTRNKFISTITPQPDPVGNYLSIPCDFRSPFPQPNSPTPSLTEVINNQLASYPENIVTDIRLVNQTWIPNNNYTYCIKDLQDFFKLPSGEIITMNRLFELNSWAFNIKKDYDFIDYNQAIENYNLFSQQILTYLNLLPFIDVVENRFKPLVKQFIPIVINLSRFGLLIRDLKKAKVRYPNIDPYCKTSIIGSNAKASFRITNGVNIVYGLPIFFQLRVDKKRDIIDVQNIGPGLVAITTLTTHGLSGGDFIEIKEVLGANNINGTYFVLGVLTPYIFYLLIPPITTPYISGGKVLIEITSITPPPLTWQYNNITSASLAATALNGYLPFVNAGISVTSDLNVVVLSTDPLTFLTQTGEDINNCEIVITTDPGIIIDQVKGFIGGTISNIVTESCAKVTYKVNYIINSNNSLFVYYDSENNLNPFIFYDSESSTELLYIY